MKMSLRAPYDTPQGDDQPAQSHTFPAPPHTHPARCTTIPPPMALIVSQDGKTISGMVMDEGKKWDAVHPLEDL